MDSKISLMQSNFYLENTYLQQNVENRRKLGEQFAKFIKKKPNIPTNCNFLRKHFHCVLLVKRHIFFVFNFPLNGHRSASRSSYYTTNELYLLIF